VRVTSNCNTLLFEVTSPALQKADSDDCTWMLCRYYSATIIKMSGVEDTSTAIWLAALTASVNFIFTFVGLFLVDRIGRRPLTLGSLAGELYFKYCFVVAGREMRLLRYYYPRRLCRSSWVGFSSPSVWLQHNSKTNDPRVFKHVTGNDIKGQGHRVSIFRSTPKSQPNNIYMGLKCPSIHAYVRPSVQKKFFPIPIKFGM